MTEQEMREAAVPTFDEPDALIDYIESLRTQPHDYGTCVYAMSMAATATFNYMARALGVTGFQASCADMDILTRTRSYKGPWAIIDSKDMLYPQYDIPAQVQKMLDGWKPWAAEEAAKLLAKPEEGPACREVVAHWKKLAADA